MSVKTFSVTITQDDLDQIGDLLAGVEDDRIQYMYFQEEVSSNTVHHLQGMIQFKERTTWNSAKWFFENLGIHDAHVEKARVVNALYEYVHKKLTRVQDGIVVDQGKFKGSGGQKRDEDGEPIVRYADVVNYYEAGGHPDEIIQHLGPNVLRIKHRTVYNEVLAARRHRDKLDLKKKADEWWYDDAYDWQKEARKILEEWSDDYQDRKVMVIYDPEGNSGKTVFCKKLQDTNPDEIACIKKAKCDDMCYLLKHYDTLKFCLVDYTRDDEKWGKGSPKFLESLKDGIVQSNKYYSENIRFPNVQVAVMTNKEMDWSTLTRDRWAVYELFKQGNKKILAEWGKSLKRDKFSGRVEVVDPYGDAKKCKYTDREDE